MSAICYSHQNDIVHRDLKPENILMENDNEDLSIKLIDWGCAKTLKKKEKLHQADGTSYYIAPEVLKGNYDEKCDIQACGVIFYILLCGYPPFNGESDEEIFEAILKGDFEFPPEEWDSVSDNAKILIQKFLTKNPKKRISSLESLQDVWFKKNEEKEETNKKLAKSVINNMKKFKKKENQKKPLLLLLLTN